MGRPGAKRDRLSNTVGVIDDLGMLDVQRIAMRVYQGATPEQSYQSAVPFAHRRRYAQFFTPPKVARLMAEWCVGDLTKSVLDPAAGMGIFIRAAIARNRDVRITAFEKDPVVLRAFLATQPDLTSVEILLGDFLTTELFSQFDAVLMNPPYLRHHDLDYEFDIFAEYSSIYGVEVSRLSNSYLLFTLKAVNALNAGGRAAVIIPTEWMNANFGTAMKRFLIERGFLQQIIYFSNCSEIFDDALTTASVLLVERPQ